MKEMDITLTYIFVADFPEVERPDCSKQHEGCARDERCSPKSPKRTSAVGLQSRRSECL